MFCDQVRLVSIMLCGLGLVEPGIHLTAVLGPGVWYLCTLLFFLGWEQMRLVSIALNGWDQLRLISILYCLAREASIRFAVCMDWNLLMLISSLAAVRLVITLIAWFWRR
jgi:hypothetical protein